MESSFLNETWERFETFFVFFSCFSQAVRGERKETRLVWRLIDWKQEIVFSHCSVLIRLSLYDFYFVDTSIRDEWTCVGLRCRRHSVIIKCNWNLNGKVLRDSINYFLLTNRKIIDEWLASETWCRRAQLIIMFFFCVKCL